jgi:hypothetical protein
MPECLECGNTDVFVYEIEGSEERAFGPNGHLTEISDTWTETTGGPECADCGSADVTNDE